jgi:hypothetical protein
MRKMRKDAARWPNGATPRSPNASAAPLTCTCSRGGGWLGRGTLGPAQCSLREFKSCQRRCIPTRQKTSLNLRNTPLRRPRILTMTTTLVPLAEPIVSAFSSICDRLLQQLLQNAEASLLFDARVRDQAENNLERFRVWGNNIAAFKNPRSTASLEHRLRDAPQVLDRFKSRLQELIDSSTQGTNELRSWPKQNRTNVSVSTSLCHSRW